MAENVAPQFAVCHPITMCFKVTTYKGGNSIPAPDLPVREGAQHVSHCPDEPTIGRQRQDQWVQACRIDAPQLARSH